MSAFLDVQHSCADRQQPLKRDAAARTGLLLILGTVLCLAMGLSLWAETGKSKELSSKPPAVAKLMQDPGKLAPEPAPAKNDSTDPALCVQPDGGAKSPAKDAQVGDGSSRAVITPANVKPSDSELSGPSSSDNSSSELIKDKLKLSLEPRTDSAAEPAAQCGREETGTQAKDKGDAPPQ